MSVLVLREKGKTLEKNFKKIFEEFGLIPKGKIFIKPNFSARPPIIPGENTDPIFLKKLINFLLKNGAEEVVIGHGTLLGTLDKKIHFEETIRKGGFSFLYRMEKVKLLNIEKLEKDVISFNGIKFFVPKIINNIDLYINLAKIKTHMETDVSLSLKNQMGLVSMMDRINMHRNNLDEYIAYLGKLIKPTINIVDGVVVMEGNGPHDGKSKRLNLLISGCDMVEVDSVVSFLLGFDFKKILHIATAERMGVGKYPEDNYLNSISVYKVIGFKKAKKYRKFLKNIYIWPTKSCSRCIVNLKEYGSMIKRNPFKNFKIIRKSILGNKKINIIIGRADQEQMKLSKNRKNNIYICLGSCTKNFARKNNIRNLDKCPPSVKEIIEYINKELS